MRLRCLAGAYAGRIQDYSVNAGQAALTAGTAERLDAPRRSVPVAVAAVADPVSSGPSLAPKRGGAAQHFRKQK